MLQELIDNLIIRLTGGLPKEKEGERLVEALSLIESEIESHHIYIKTKDGSQILYTEETPSDCFCEAKGICVTYRHEEVEPWESKAPAERMREKLSKILRTEPVVLLSRDPDSFSGYYVYIKSV